MTARLAVLVGLEQLGAQAPGLRAETLAGQFAAALVRGPIAGLRPDRPGRDRKDRTAPGPEQATGGPVRLAPARLQQPERHVDPAVSDSAASDTATQPLRHASTPVTPAPLG